MLRFDIMVKVNFHKYMTSGLFRITSSLELFLSDVILRSSNTGKGGAVGCRK